MSRFVRKGLPWVIGKNVTDCHTAQEVMTKAGLDYTVAKCELLACMPMKLDGSEDIKNGEFIHGTNVYRPCPSAYATYRTDKNIPLGIVKDKYTIVQNRDAFNFFNTAIGEDKALWDYAGGFPDGHKIYVSAKLPIETDVNGDKIDNYLVFTNSHDGTSSVNILFTPVRVYCTNCLQSAIHSANSFIRIRHTESAKEKLEIGAQILKVSMQQAQTAQELYRSLERIPVTDHQFLEYIGNLLLTEKEKEDLNLYDPKYGLEKVIRRDYQTMKKTNISTRKANMMFNMYDYYKHGIGQEEIAGTGWGAYNAVTGYYCNVANGDGLARMSTLLYGTANNTMRKSLDLIRAYA